MGDDAFPSFLIGLREGLEAGLIVSILVATLVRAGARSRLLQVWTGVLAAVALAMSFGAVLTFTAASLSATAQEAFGGTLSLIAVAFVTAMVFSMRRSARSLSGEIKEKVTSALGMGAGVLVVTSFLAVGREGLETALFRLHVGTAEPGPGALQDHGDRAAQEEQGGGLAERVERGELAAPDHAQPHRGAAGALGVERIPDPSSPSAGRDGCPAMLTEQ
ncbi:FTR1 family protein [Streptomyces sp. NPDC049541]|uniref:FTR1 family protein n=1 Tax=Streptomyces sp. NPDC049541 TaxID=3365594 RepID=UPI0037ADB747